MDKMTRWRNSPQKKEQKVLLTTRVFINMDINKMCELKFKTMMIKILDGFESTIEGTRESLTVDIKELKSNQTNINNAIIEMQSQVESIEI